MDKFWQSLVVLVLEIGTFNLIILRDLSKKEGFIIIILAGFQFYAVSHYSNQRVINIANTLNTHGPIFFKLEIEAEKVLIDMITKVQNLIENYDIVEVFHSQAFAEFQSIMKFHTYRCSRSVCKCHNFKRYLDLLREGQLQRVGQGEHVLVTYKKLIKTYDFILNEIDGNNSYESGMQSFLNPETSHRSRYKLETAGLGSVGSGTDTNQRYVRVNIKVIRRKLFSEIILIIAQEVRERFPKSLKLYLLECYIQAAIMRKPLICLNTMRSFQAKHLSAIDQVSMKVNEKYLLTRLGLLDESETSTGNSVPNYEISQSLFSGSSQTSVLTSDPPSLTLNLNVEHFIDLDQLQVKYTKCIIQLATSVFQFWNIFDCKSSRGGVFQSAEALKIGYMVAKNIKAVFDCYHMLDKISIKKDPSLYLKYARVQRFLLNDNSSYSSLIAKMRSILDMRKIGFNRLESHFFTEDSAFLIVEGRMSLGIDHGLGGYGDKILMINETANKLFMKGGEGNFKNRKITSLMPKIISDEHNKIMEKFNMHGESQFLNRYTVQLIINSELCLVPVSMMIKLHFSLKFGFCFFAGLTPIKVLTPFTNCLEYPIEQLYLLTINLKSGRIYEFSENFVELLKTGGAKAHKSTIEDIKDQLIDEKKLQIDELIEDLQFQDYLNQRQYNTQQGKLDSSYYYERVHQVNMKCLAGTELFDRNIKHLSVRVSIRSEIFGRGLGEIGYAVLMLDDDITARPNTQGLFISVLESSVKETDQMGKFRKSIGKIEDHEAAENQSDSIVSGDAMSQSMESSYDDNSYIANDSQYTSLAFLTRSKSAFKMPKSLQIVLQLVLTLFVVSVTIASINLFVNLQSRQDSENTIITVRKSLNRINFTSSSRLILRNMLNIANGYEPNASPIIADRWTFYQERLTVITDLLKATQNYLDTTSKYEYSSSLLALKQSRTLKILSIDGQSKIFTQNASMAQAVNLYTSKLTALNSQSIEAFRGQLYLQTLEPNKTRGFQLNFNEQSVFFCVINGNGVVREYNWVFTNRYLQDAAISSEGYQNITMITTIVSILSIFLVLLIIAPIISKTEERKYLALSFFLKIPDDVKERYIQNCRCFKLLEDIEPKRQHSDNYFKKEESVDSYQTKQVSYMEDQIDEEYKDELYGVDSQVSLRINSDCNKMNAVNIFQSMGHKNRARRSSSRISNAASKLVTQNLLLIRAQKTILEKNFNQMDRMNSTPNRQDSALMSPPPMLGKHLSVLPSFERGPTIHSPYDFASMLIKIEPPQSSSHQSKQDYMSSLDKKDTLFSTKDEHIKIEKQPFKKQQTRMFKEKQLPLVKETINETKQEDLKESIPIDEPTTLDASKGVVTSEDIMVIIKQQANREKFKSLITIMLLMIIFTLYFVGSYLIAIENFGVTTKSVQDLNVIIFKEACFENMITFIRENLIRNESVRLSEDNKTIASASLINGCMKRENFYLQLKKNLPNYLQGAKQIMSDMDSADFCAKIYNGLDETLIKRHCQTTLNGLLNMGVSNTLAYMYRKAQKLQRRFDSVNPRDLEYLESSIADQETIEIIDVKLYLFTKPFEMLKNASVQSVLDYFNSIMLQIIILYCAFLLLIVLLLVLFFGFVIKRLRNTMWNTNLLLGIIPASQVLNRDLQTQLQKFYVN